MGRIRFDRSFRNYRSSAVPDVLVQCNGSRLMDIILLICTTRGKEYSNNAEWKDLITDCFWLLDRWYRHRRGSILDILFVMIRSVMRYYWSALLGNLCAGWKIVYVSSSMVSSVWMFFVDFVRDFSIFVMILLIRTTCGIIRNGNIWFISALFRLLDRLVSFFCCCLRLNVLYGFWWYYYPWNLW